MRYSIEERSKIFGEEIDEEAMQQVSADFIDYLRIRILFWAIAFIDWKKIYNTNCEQAYIGGKDGL